MITCESEFDGGHGGSSSGYEFSPSQHPHPLGVTSYSDCEFSLVTCFASGMTANIRQTETS